MSVGLETGRGLPAGHYDVFHPSDPKQVILQKDDGRARAVVFVQVSQPNENTASTKLVFNKYGEQFFLSQVWTEYDRELHQVVKCKAEQNLQAKFGKAGVTTILAKQ